MCPLPLLNQSTEYFVMFHFKPQAMAGCLMQTFDTRTKMRGFTDLSELGSGLFLLHSAMSHEVVEYFAWKRERNKQCW